MGLREGKRVMSASTSKVEADRLGQPKVTLASGFKAKAGTLGHSAQFSLFSWSLPLSTHVLFSFGAHVTIVILDLPLAV